MSEKFWKQADNNQLKIALDTFLVPRAASWRGLPKDEELDNELERKKRTLELEEMSMAAKMRIYQLQPQLATQKMALEAEEYP